MNAGIYLFKVNSRNTRTRSEICSKLTIKTPEGPHWCRFGVFIVNFKHVSHLALVFLLLTLKSAADLTLKTIDIHLVFIEKYFINLPLADKHLYTLLSKQ